MKKWLAIVTSLLCFALLPTQQTTAQIPIAEIIKKAVVKVIKAVDLKVQRLQNKTIWLQNAQKTLENEMSQNKLREIKTWVEKQRQLYDDYFQELWKVKTALTHYSRVKDIIGRQVQLVNEYKRTWTLFKQDKNFTKEEMDYMHTVYSGMLAESLKGMDQLSLVVNAFATQMSDAKRLDVINRVADNLAQRFAELNDFSNQNKMLSLQRATETVEIERVKRLYGLGK